MPSSDSKWLTFLVYFLLAILTLTTGWSTLGLSALKDNLPKEFVRLERYSCDIEKIEKQLDKLDRKLDRIIWPNNRE